MKRLAVAACLLASLACHQAFGAGAIEPFRRGSYAALLSANAGRPLVVHFWSITCAPCLAEMPRWAGLQQRHPEVKLVLVSTDPLAEAARLSAALERYGLSRIDSMAFADSFRDRLFFEVDRSWRGELPRSQFIGSDGAVTPSIGAVDDAFLQQWLARQGVEDGTRGNSSKR